MMMARQARAKIVGRPCKRCGGTERYGGSYGCVTCTNTRSKASKATKAYKDKAKRYWLAKRYGLTPEKIDAILALQGGRCACCGSDDPRSRHGWMVDHCHKTGQIRGILCDPCNVGIGRFDDSQEKLRLAIAYLNRSMPLSPIKTETR